MAHGDHEHGHDHGHTPRDAHEHEHEHDHEHGGNRELPEGAGKGKLLFFDAFSGAAGDMTIAALLDLGVPLRVVGEAAAQLPITGYHLHRGHVHRSGIAATKFDVHVDGHQPERTYG